MSKRNKIINRVLHDSFLFNLHLKINNIFFCEIALSINKLIVANIAFN